MKNLDIKILKVILVTSTFWFGNAVLAQDIHFSQFNSSPILINPAATGTSEFKRTVKRSALLQTQRATCAHETA